MNKMTLFVCLAFICFTYMVSAEIDRKTKELLLTEEDSPRFKRLSNYYPNGWRPTCDQNNCRRVGTGMIRMGPCENSFCNCAHGIPYLQNCGHDLIYDDTIKSCNWRYNVRGC